MTFKSAFEEIFNAPFANEGGVDRAELAMGMEVEKEHGNLPETRKRIALAHLREIPDYYSRLKRMEKEAGKQ